MENPHAATEENSSLDRQLAEAANFTIEWLTAIPLDTVQVSAHDGLVYLDGTVQQPYQRIALETVTRKVPRVKGVINCLEVAPAPAVSELPPIRRNGPATAGRGQGI